MYVRHHCFHEDLLTIFPAIPFEILNVWYSCDTVTIRWRSAQTPQIVSTRSITSSSTLQSDSRNQVTGIIVLETVFAPSGDQFPWKISAVYSEFNSGSWLVNLGVFQPSNCTAPA